MDYPEDKDTKSSSIRIKKSLNQAIEKFMKTQKAKDAGFDHKSDVANAAVRQLLQRFGLRARAQPGVSEYECFCRKVSNGSNSID